MREDFETAANFICKNALTSGFDFRRVSEAWDQFSRFFAAFRSFTGPEEDLVCEIFCLESELRRIRSAVDSQRFQLQNLLDFFEKLVFLLRVSPARFAEKAETVKRFWEAQGRYLCVVSEDFQEVGLQSSSYQSLLQSSAAKNLIEARFGLQSVNFLTEKSPKVSHAWLRFCAEFESSQVASRSFWVQPRQRIGMLDLVQRWLTEDAGRNPHDQPPVEFLADLRRCCQEILAKTLGQLATFRPVNRWVGLRFLLTEDQKNYVSKWAGQDRCCTADSKMSCEQLDAYLMLLLENRLDFPVNISNTGRPKTTLAKELLKTRDFHNKIYCLVQNLKSAPKPTGLFNFLVKRLEEKIIGKKLRNHGLGPTTPKKVIRKAAAEVDFMVQRIFEQAGPAFKPWVRTEREFSVSLSVSNLSDSVENLVFFQEFNQAALETAWQLESRVLPVLLDRMRTQAYQKTTATTKNTQTRLPAEKNTSEMFKKKISSASEVSEYWKLWYTLEPFQARKMALFLKVCQSMVPDPKEKINILKKLFEKIPKYILEIEPKAISGTSRHQQLEGVSRNLALWTEMDLAKVICSLDEDAKVLGKHFQNSFETFPAVAFAKGVALKARLQQLEGLPGYREEAMQWMSALSVTLRDVFPSAVAASCYGLEHFFDITSSLLWSQVLFQMQKRFNIRVSGSYHETPEKQRFQTDGSRLSVVGSEAELVFFFSVLFQEITARFMQSNLYLQEIVTKKGKKHEAPFLFRFSKSRKRVVLDFQKAEHGQKTKKKGQTNRTDQRTKTT